MQIALFVVRVIIVALTLPIVDMVFSSVAVAPGIGSLALVAVIYSVAFWLLSRAVGLVKYISPVLTVFTGLALLVVGGGVTLVITGALAPQLLQVNSYLAAIVGSWFIEAVNFGGVIVTALVLGGAKPRQ